MAANQTIAIKVIIKRNIDVSICHQGTPKGIRISITIGDVKGKTCVIVDDIIDSGGTIVNAAKALKEVDTDRYVTYIKKAIDIYSMSGRASTSASMAKECAQKLEEDKDYEEAIKMY